MENNLNKISVKAGFMFTPSINPNGASDEKYGYSLNMTLFGSVEYKKSEFLFGATKIHIPDIDFNRNNLRINEKNRGVHLGFRYHFENKKNLKFNPYFQYLVFLVKTDYLEYSLGSDPKRVQGLDHDHSIGLGINYELHHKLRAYSGVNVGIIFHSVNVGVNYQFN